MKLVVISPESADPREVDVVRTMLARGLTRYHVRKPSWTEPQLMAWAEVFSKAERSHFVLHGEEALARRLSFGGAHWRDDAHAPKNFSVTNLRKGPNEPRFVRSRSCHDLGCVRTAIGVYDSVFLSPVFPSLSKPDYGETRSWSDVELQTLLAARDVGEFRTDVIALGGIQKNTTARCRELGFDGAAALGAIWDAADPIAAFVELRDAFSAFADRPLLAKKDAAVSNIS